MKLLAVLVFALAAVDVSGTSADSNDCLCVFPNDMTGFGTLQMLSESRNLSEQAHYFHYVKNGTLGRLGLWLAPPLAEYPDYIMDLKMNLLYKLDRNLDMTCTKTALTDEWRFPNCFLSGLSLDKVTSTGQYIYRNEDHSRVYYMNEDQKTFTEEKPCTPSNVVDYQNVAGFTRTLFLYTGADFPNAENIALDLNKTCANVEAIYLP